MHDADVKTGGRGGGAQTTLMDVLAGRKTGGRIEGDVRVQVLPAPRPHPAPLHGPEEWRLSLWPWVQMLCGR